MILGDHSWQTCHNDYCEKFSSWRIDKSLFIHSFRLIPTVSAFYPDLRKLHSLRFLKRSLFAVQNIFSWERKPLSLRFNASWFVGQIPFHLMKRIFNHSKVDDFVKSLNQTAKKKDPDARRANPEEWGVHRSTLQWLRMKRNTADGLFTKPSKFASLRT